MSDAVRVLAFSATIAVAAVLGRRWPASLGKIARISVVIVGIALTGIIATGWGRRAGAIAEIHRWAPHALFILAWNTVPFTIGVTMTRPRRHPLVATAYGLVSLSMLGVIFLASTTGYLGTSRRPLDTMTLLRFQVVHYGVFPSLAIAISALAYHGLRSHRDHAPMRVPGPSVTT